MGCFSKQPKDPNKGKYVKIVNVIGDKEFEKAMTDILLSGRIIKEIHYSFANSSTHSALIIFDVEKEEQLKNR
ncbi:hypothetical protein IX317_001517 [Fusobacterium sp. DD29]|uniref:hypothetical protein n=1 Tax=unclassified Fusobacterium TaxID=2648384 RepID=UPI001B8AFBA3|nr:MULTISPECIES: hypothetical protein [unclassified Fusobacterium]MBR8701280.1 hypothetical protein [Fusobacterium sp. DD45]MBR8711047.1 hypothetical protein [Fusobacterium sp. DD28]MBR8749839.1 hypothetical protein [Fusobacterium sp. DD29]MBR8751622.1 hypothetical protein [Fusobacterium sp. DD26]MBR8762081.1 hypothetical protein [Fusobacterium sp. DD25]